MKQRYLFLFLLSILISCGSDTELLEAEKEAIIHSVKIRLKAFQRDVRQNGLSAQIDYMDDSDDFFWTPPGYDSALSYDSLSKILRLNTSKYTFVTNKFDSLRILPLTKTMASYTSRIHSTMIDTLGNRSAFSLIETGLLIKREKKWMLLNGQTSVITN